MTKNERKPIPSIALTTDTSFLTAWTNDTDFETVFSRQIQGIDQRRSRGHFNKWKFEKYNCGYKTSSV